MKKKRGLLTAGLYTLLAVGTLALAGCDSKLIDAQAKLNETIKENLNSCEVLDSYTTDDINKVEFTGADFEKSSDKYRVKVSGLVSSGAEENKAYIQTSYDVDQTYFANVTKDSAKYEILDILSQIIEEQGIENLSWTKVNDLKALNSSVTDSIESPLQNYNSYRGLVYSLSTPTFNEEENFVSFQAKTYVDYSKTESEMTVGIVSYGEDGPVYGPVVVYHTYYEDFVHTTNIYVKVTDAEMSSMKNDSSLVYDKFCELYKAKDTSKYTIQSVEVEKDLIFDTNMRNDASLDFGK